MQLFAVGQWLSRPLQLPLQPQRLCDYQGSLSAVAWSIQPSRLQSTAAYDKDEQANFALLVRRCDQLSMRVPVLFHLPPLPELS